MKLDSGLLELKSPQLISHQPDADFRQSLVLGLMVVLLKVIRRFLKVLC